MSDLLPDRLNRPFFWLAWTVCRTGLMLYNRMRAEGRANIPATGPLLVVCNHASHIDPVAVAVCQRRRRLRFMAKIELWNNKVLGAAISRLGAYPVRRGESDRASWATSVHHLKQGEALLVFPEGGRSPDGRLGEFEGGAARLALAVPGTRIVPARIIGSFDALPPGVSLPRPRSIVVRFGPAFLPDEVLPAGQPKKALYHALTALMFERIAALEN